MTASAAGVYGDSADFTLNTTDGLTPGVYADAADFTLNTTDPASALGQDIGLRIHDGTGIVKIACVTGGTLTSPLRITKNGITYGIVLTETNLPDASKMRIQTATGIKALKKLP